jgi:hypothetical protein
MQQLLELEQMISSLVLVSKINIKCLLKKIILIHVQLLQKVLLLLKLKKLFFREFRNNSCDRGLMQATILDME